MQYTHHLSMAQLLEEVVISTSQTMLVVQHLRTQTLVTHTALLLATVINQAIHERCLLVVTTSFHRKLKFSILSDS